MNKLKKQKTKIALLLFAVWLLFVGVFLYTQGWRAGVNWYNVEDNWYATGMWEDEAEK